MHAHTHWTLCPETLSSLVKVDELEKARLAVAFHGGIEPVARV